MLEHGKKGICLGDSDMFQHFPTGSCTSQNNCNPGSCPLAYDYICIMLQRVATLPWASQGCRAHDGALCCVAGEKGSRETTTVQGPASRKQLDHQVGTSGGHLSQMRRRPRERNNSPKLTFWDYKRKPVGEQALNSSQLMLVFLFE